MTIPKDIRLIGGTVCFDFINTIHDRSKKDSIDYINEGYTGLIAWSIYAKLFPSSMLESVLEKSTVKSQKAEIAYQRALKLREILFSIFSAIADKTEPEPDDIATFNWYLSNTFVHIQVKKNKDNFEDCWDTKEHPFDLVLWPIIKSAHNILVNENLERVKKCPACFWIFIDTSKAGKRVWCSMEACGANEKAKRYYYRNKGKAK